MLTFAYPSRRHRCWEYIITHGSYAYCTSHARLHALHLPINERWKYIYSRTPLTNHTRIIALTLARNANSFGTNIVFFSTRAVNYAQSQNHRIIPCYRKNDIMCLPQGLHKRNLATV